MLALCTLLACTPSSVSDAEKKGDVYWLEHQGSSEAVSALGRLADEDKSAQKALESIAQRTENGKTVEGGAGAVDVYLAVWSAVERDKSWANAMMKSALGAPARMEDAASAVKLGSPHIAAFVPELDAAIGRGCGRCALALASASGAPAEAAMTRRLDDAKTRDAMCAGLGGDSSSKGARAVFMRAPVASRDAPSCPGAAARMAAHDDEALAWLGQTAEPGLVRVAGASDALSCPKLARLWSTVFTTRDRATYVSLEVPLKDAVTRCPKDLDATLAVALASDAESQSLAVAGMTPTDVSAATFPRACAAIGDVARGAATPPIKARAADVAARCR
jgi:hypothetical protein